MKVTFDKLGGIKEIFTDDDTKNWIKKGYSVGLPYGPFKVQLIADSVNAIKCVYLSNGLNVEVVRRIYDNEVRESYKIHNPYSNIVYAKEYEMGIEIPFITQYLKKDLHVETKIQGTGSWYAVTEDDGRGIAVLCVKGEVGGYALSSRHKIGAFSFLLSDFDIGYDAFEQIDLIYFPINSLEDIARKAKEYGVFANDILPCPTVKSGETFHLNLQQSATVEKEDTLWQSINQNTPLVFHTLGEKRLRVKCDESIFDFYVYVRKETQTAFFDALNQENNLFSQRFEALSEKKFLRRYVDEFQLYLACLSAYQKTYEDNRFDLVLREGVLYLKNLKESILKRIRKTAEYRFLSVVLSEEERKSNREYTAYSLLYPVQAIADIQITESVSFIDKLVITLKKGEELTPKDLKFIEQMIAYNSGISDYRAYGWNNGLYEFLTFDRIKAGAVLALYAKRCNDKAAEKAAKNIFCSSTALLENGLNSGYTAPVFVGRKNGLEAKTDKLRFASLYLLLEYAQWIN